MKQKGVFFYAGEGKEQSSSESAAQALALNEEKAQPRGVKKQCGNR